MNIINEIIEIKENLINDYNDFLKENDYIISNNYLLNEIYINEYLQSIFYNIQDNVEDPQKNDEIQNDFFEILENYCISQKAY